MPRDGRDEIGRISQDVSRFLTPHNKPGFTVRTEVNVRTAAAVLIIVRTADDPRTTPGTTKTLDLAAIRRLPRLVIDPTTDPTRSARWIWNTLLTNSTLALALETPTDASPGTIQPRLLVAGPRESKWQGAQIETGKLLRRIAQTPR